MSGERWGARRPGGFHSPPKWFDPMPPRGLCEATYCGIRARFGYWPADFLAHVERSYRGKIPPRFLAIVAKLERDRPWERCAHGVSLLVDSCLACLT